jgi:ferric-dicitrate binding protein FerR (iron transport regulator)
MNSPSRFDDLASRCLEGTLDAHEEKEFLALLDDPANRRAFAELERINLELLATLAAPLPDEEMLRLVMKDAKGVSSVGSTQRAQAVMDRVQSPSGRQVSRKRKTKHSALALPVGLAALLALVLGVFWVQRTKTPALDVVARVVSVKGEAALVRSDKVSALKTDADVASEDAFNLGIDGRAELLYADGTRIILNSGARVQIQKSQGKRLHITSGSLSAAVPPQPPDQPLRVTSPHAEARVIGTRLQVDVRKTSTRLDVEEGKVRFTSVTRDSVDVADGQYAIAETGAPLAVRPIKPIQPIAPAAVVAESEPAWEPLSVDLRDWSLTRGSARSEDGMLILQSAERRGASRAETKRHFPAVEIECELRITGAHLAEFQLESYRWFFQIDLTPEHKNEWHTFKAVFNEHGKQAWLDGQPLKLRRGESIGQTGGPIAFYVTYGGKLEIRNAKIRAPKK